MNAKLSQDSNGLSGPRSWWELHRKGLMRVLMEKQGIKLCLDLNLLATSIHFTCSAIKAKNWIRPEVFFRLPKAGIPGMG